MFWVPHYLIVYINQLSELIIVVVFFTTHIWLVHSETFRCVFLDWWERKFWFCNDSIIESFRILLFKPIGKFFLNFRFGFVNFAEFKFLFVFSYFFLNMILFFICLLSFLFFFIVHFFRFVICFIIVLFLKSKFLFIIQFRWLYFTLNNLFHLDFRLVKFVIRLLIFFNLFNFFLVYKFLTFIKWFFINFAIFLSVFPINLILIFLQTILFFYLFSFALNRVNYSDPINVGFQILHFIFYRVLTIISQINFLFLLGCLLNEWLDRLCSILYLR